MSERRVFGIRPLQYNDIVVIENRPLWGQPRVNISPHHKGIGAIAEDGSLVGYCGFYDTPRRSEARISAVQSRMPGAGTALLNALKARFYYLVAEDVLSSAEAWWKRRGFVLLHPATGDDEEDVVGTYTGLFWASSCETQHVSPSPDARPRRYAPGFSPDRPGV